MGFLSLLEWRGGRTICSFTVLPSSSMVRIFCESQSLSTGGVQQHGGAGRRAYEVNADGGDVGLCVGVVGEAKEQARLADTGIADEQQLEEIVVSGIVSAAGGARGGRGSQRAGVVAVVDRAGKPGKAGGLGIRWWNGKGNTLQVEER